MKRLACVIVLATFVFGLAMPKQSEANDVVWALLGGLLLGAALSQAADEAPGPGHVYYVPKPVYAYPQPVPVYVNPPHYYGYSQRENSGHRRDRRPSPPPSGRRDHRR